MSDTKLTFRRYEDNDNDHVPWDEDVISSGESYICPTYIQRTPPCQNACPSGHDIRGWLSIVRGLDQPPEGMSWEEYAFRRMTMSNPFPALMGRVCPAPCQDSCNRIEVDGFVGINSIEQYIGDWARENDIKFDAPPADTGKKVAVVGSGPAGLAAAYFLRRLGHAATIFEEYHALGGMTRFGLPEYRVPRDMLEVEINRILDLGVDVKLNTRVGRDVSIEDLEKDYDAIFWGVGCVEGKALPIPGNEAPNVTDGMTFLKAFNEGRMKYLSGRILVIGGGDTAMDVAAVAKRIGDVADADPANYTENVLAGKVEHTDADAAKRGEADCWLVYRRPIDKAPCTAHELKAIKDEGVEIHDSLAPVEAILDENGRARALKVQPVDWSTGKMVETGEPFEIECTMIVGATGQKGNLEGIESLDNGWSQIDSEKTMQVKGKPGHFVGGDAVSPKLLTTAIGHASIAVESIDSYLKTGQVEERPKIDVHCFDMLNELKQRGLEPEQYDHVQNWGTFESKAAIHNFENRAEAEVVKDDELFKAYFSYEPAYEREETDVNASNVLGNMQERFTGLEEESAKKEAGRCMSCGMCFECDNCVIYCPQDAVIKVKKGEKATGRYVETDYFKCVGCHICKEVCPTGYIEMGLGFA
jgi:NADPH-dependent glutamate synthase beta subunit-like oxidoreductase/Pyruvate/2-oxoacid:ferredoxin oxidoreductase delta subunit